LRVAIANSLQGNPEENSPLTPVDCRRLSTYIYNLLADMFPQVEVELFNREDVGGTGDEYLPLRNKIVAWGADIAVHMHQDAGPEGARGWHIIYYHEEALPLAYAIESYMDDLPSPEKYGGVVPRDNVAAVKLPYKSVLIEAGFYTSAEDEALGIAGWGDPVVKGVSLYLQQLGIYPIDQEEEEDMATYAPRQVKDTTAGKKVYVFDDAFIGDGYVCYWNAYNEDGPEISYEVYTSLWGNVVKETVAKGKRASVDLTKCTGDYKGGFSVIVKTSIPFPGVLTIMKG
jgi:hypothetical protein